MEKETLFVSIENLQPISCCRICLEEELESSNRLEAPCSCIGTAQFAHRECIQRWCDVKGNTTCEICLQNYEPGYTAPPKKARVMEEEVDTISFPSGEGEEDDEEDDTLMDTDLSECLFLTVSCCKTVALVLTALLLVRELLVLYCEAANSPFPLILTVLALRLSGIVIPMYIIIKTITGIQNRIRRRLQRRLRRLNRDHLRISIDIQS